MRAALFDHFGGPLRVERVADPDCPRDGVVVAVAACGVCRSDWHAWKGADAVLPLPHVPGHEFAGTVEAVGPDCRGFAVGQRVTAPFILGCGRCPDCLAGEPTVCAAQEILGFTGWGAYAERLAVPRADYNLVAVPEALDLVAVAGMGCRVTTAYRALVDRARLAPGEWLAVQGCGGVGLSAVAIAAALGAEVVAVDVNDEALALARRLGARHVLNSQEAADVGEAVRDLTGGGAHVSLEALGITETFQASLRSLRPLGRHVQVGLPTERHATPTLPLLDLVYARQLSLHGTRGMAASGFPALFALVAEGRLDLASLVTRRIALEEAGAALAAMDRPGPAGIAVIDRFA